MKNTATPGMWHGPLIYPEPGSSVDVTATNGVTYSVDVCDVDEGVWVLDSGDLVPLWDVRRWRYS